MTKGIVYYTSNILEERTFRIVQEQIQKSGLPIVSVSLKPTSFGKNFVLDLKPGMTTVFRQIYKGIEESDADVLFFCEHDVLYHPSHFNFNPTDNKVFYYNVNVWRWDFPFDKFITYDHLRSLSGICASRELLLEHYRKRIRLIEEKGWGDTSREPKWSRMLGHEPGKNKVRSDIFKDTTQEWMSEFPNIDIRHLGTITRRKCRLVDFRKPPTNWREITASLIPGWNIKELFHL